MPFSTCISIAFSHGLALLHLGITATSTPAIMKQILEPILEHEHPLKEHLSAATATSNDGDRFSYLSNLKAFLTALVILHHTAVAYGGAGQHVYNGPDEPPRWHAGLVAFNAINQTFFMALFFFIAGFLSRRGLDQRMKKDGTTGAWMFVRNRIWRLGVPTLVYSILEPALCEGFILGARRSVVAWQDVWRHISSVRGVRGPVWFCVLLLIFDGILATLWGAKRTYSRHGFLGQDQKPVMANGSPTLRADITVISSGWLFASVGLLTLADYLWRSRFPIGMIYGPLNINLGYLPQYVATYTFGLLVPDPTSAVPERCTTVCLGVASAASSQLLAYSIAGSTDLVPIPGGLHAVAASYAVWNNCTGYLIGSSLLRLFHECVYTPRPRITNLAYSAFLLHIPVSTIVQLSFESWQAGVLTKTVVVGAINIVCSWTAALIWEVIWTSLRRTLAVLPSAVATSKHSPANRRQTSSKGARAIEILEGLDDVGR